MQDGRIHPARIEEVVATTSKEMEEELLKIGKEAVQEAQPRRTSPSRSSRCSAGSRYRTSYGQNVLRHSMEVAYLAQMIADELGLDGTLARRCGLLHDIGKAMDHETEGGHPQIGMEFLRAVQRARGGAERRAWPTTATCPRRRRTRRSSWPPTRSAPAAPARGESPGALRQAPARPGRPGHDASKASARPTPSRPAARSA